MFSFSKAKKVANIVIDDYVVRIVENSGNDLSTIKLIDEKPIPPGLVVNGKIADDMLFFNFMKETVREWQIKHRLVQFYVPDSLVIMRHVDYPASLEEHEEIVDHLNLEIGQTIHLPFQNPIIDVHTLSEAAAAQEENGNGNRNVKKATMFAVPEEEVSKYADVFVDCTLKPVAADVRALGIYRYFHHMDHSNDRDVFLFMEVNLTSVSISIFHQHQLEFLRFQSFDIDAKLWIPKEDEEELTWKYKGNEEELMTIIEEQVSELDRIISFYNYSLHKGSKQVSQIVLLGDYPNLYDVLQDLESRYNLNVHLLKAYETKEKIKEIGRQFIPVLGLALKEGE